MKRVSNVSDQSRSPLRIGFRVGVFPKLSETFVLNQINALMDRGHDVSILAEERPETLDPSLAQDTEAARARTRYLKAENELKRTLSSALPYRIRRAMEAREERRLLSECDVVVCNFGWFGARMFEATDDPSEHAKLVTILHGDDMSRHLSGGNEHAYDGLVKSGGLLLSVNEIWKARLKARGAPDHLNLIHHLGVDPSKFEFVDRDCAKDEPTVLTIVCRMVEKKGLAYALQALHQVRTSRPDLRFEFRLYGDGPLRAELVALAEELGIDDCVHFKGSIPNAEVRTAFANADVFLHPSVTADDGDMEGLPTSMMEAMATG
ncbi:MAG: glycosyltransferase, partial [Pseudomonadota bacterium]